MRWTPDLHALEMLDAAGCPFERSAYRAACVEVLDGVRDLSFGAVAEDGTRAAVALLGRPGGAESVPYGYGGVRATRPLDAGAARSFLDAARRKTGVRRLVVRSVAPTEADGLGDRIATTLVVPLDGPPEARLAKKAQQSIRRAARAGCVVQPTPVPDAFLRLYATASQEWAMQYPQALIRRLAELGEARFYDVVADGEAVASLAALVRGSHWMYWLAAQNAIKRKAEAGYLAVADLIRDAHTAGAAFVNLGASEGLPGVGQFKRRLGGVERPVERLASMPRATMLHDAAARRARQVAASGRAVAARASRTLPLR